MTARKDNSHPPRRWPTGWPLKAGVAVAMLSAAAVVWWFSCAHPAAKWQNRTLMACLCVLAGLWTAGLVAWRRWRLLAMTGLDLLTAVLLTFSFTPWGWWPLAYVALVPWLAALHVGRESNGAVWLGGITGFVFWAGNLYWMTWITPLGHAAATLYLTSFWLVAAWGVRTSLRRRWPCWLVLPMLWVALEYARTYLLGFPWLFLAHSQYARTALIQISDLTGQYGVSFFVAMVNGLVADAVLSIARPAPGVRRTTRPVLVGACVVAASLAGLLVYGHWRLGQHTQSDGPAIAIVQQAVPATLYGDALSSEEVLRLYLTDTRALIGTGCDVVIWPEGTLTFANPDLLQTPVERLEHDSLRGLAKWFFRPGDLGTGVADEKIAAATKDLLSMLRADAEAVGELSAELGCPILTGNSALRPLDQGAGSEWGLMNDAMMLDGSGLASSWYSKVHPVPFGEYVPFRESFPAMHRLLKSFVPPVRSQIEPGRRYTNFRLTRPDGQWKLATPICYEGTFARVCRRMVMRDGRKDVDILANLSSDGWFVYTRRDGTDRMSVEHAQHLAAYCFRAVENRVPVVRAVNTGISASIDSNGRIVASLPEAGRFADGSRIVTGTLLLGGPPSDAGGGVVRGPKVLVDHRVSRYSLIGDVFARLICIVATIMLIWARLRPMKGSLTAT